MIGILARRKIIVPIIILINFKQLLTVEQLPDHSKKSFDRRQFIDQGIKLTLLAGLVSPLAEACNIKPKKPAKKNAKDRSNTINNNSKRRKWNAEKLVINTKTNVIHLPTSAFYIYYDEIKNSRDLSISDWENQLQGQVRLNKDKSGNTLEILSLQKLKTGVTDNSLSSAANTLAIAFSNQCSNSRGINDNTTNYRLHELMLQFVTLNNSISDKWQTFNQLVSKPQRLGKRQAWMENEENFNERVNYIRGREADYKNRLIQRASKYTLT